MFQEASTATKILHEEVEQRKADAKRIAQEVGVLRRCLRRDCLLWPPALLDYVQRSFYVVGSPHKGKEGCYMVLDGGNTQSNNEH